MEIYVEKIPVCNSEIETYIEEILINDGETEIWIEEMPICNAEMEFCIVWILVYITKVCNYEGKKERGEEVKGRKGEEGKGRYKLLIESIRGKWFYVDG